MTTNNAKQRATLFANPPTLKQARTQVVIEELSLTTLVEKSLINYLLKETVIKKSYIRIDPDP